MIYYYIITGVIDGEHYTKTVGTDGGLQEAENMFHELVFKDMATEYEMDYADISDQYASAWIVCVGKSASPITSIYGVGK